MLDLRKKIFFWSDVAEQITGYPRIDVLGHAYSDLQGIEDVAVGPGIFEKWHGSWTTVFAGLPIGQKSVPTSGTAIAGKRFGEKPGSSLMAVALLGRWD